MSMALSLGLPRFGPQSDVAERMTGKDDGPTARPCQTVVAVDRAFI